MSQQCLGLMSRFQYLRRRISFGAGLVLPILLIAICWMPVAAAATYGIGVCPNVYRQCLAEWKAERIAYLKSDQGYLNLAGLFWLREGISTFGSGAGSDLLFPAAALPEMGTFELGESGVVMNLRGGADVRMDGNPVSRVQLADDTSDQPSVVTFGSFAWTVIRRDDRFAVRLRDFDHPALSTFPPIDYYPTDENLRVEARLLLLLKGLTTILLRRDCCVSTLAVSHSSLRRITPVTSSCLCLAMQPAAEKHIRPDGSCTPINRARMAWSYSISIRRKIHHAHSTSTPHVRLRRHATGWLSGSRQGSASIRQDTNFHDP